MENHGLESGLVQFGLQLKENPKFFVFVSSCK